MHKVLVFFKINAKLPHNFLLHLEMFAVSVTQPPSAKYSGKILYNTVVVPKSDANHQQMGPGRPLLVEACRRLRGLQRRLHNCKLPFLKTQTHLISRDKSLENLNSAYITRDPKTTAKWCKRLVGLVLYCFQTSGASEARRSTGVLVVGRIKSATQGFVRDENKRHQLRINQG